MTPVDFATDNCGTVQPKINEGSALCTASRIDTDRYAPPPPPWLFKRAVLQWAVANLVLQCAVTDLAAMGSSQSGAAGSGQSGSSYVNHPSFQHVRDVRLRVHDTNKFLLVDGSGKVGEAEGQVIEVWVGQPYEDGVDVYAFKPNLGEPAGDAPSPRARWLVMDDANNVKFHRPDCSSWEHFFCCTPLLRR